MIRKSLLLLLTLIPIVGIACDAGFATLATKDQQEIGIQLEPAEPEVGVPFIIFIDTCRTDANIDQIEVDAIMPQHNHGMNYQPTVAQLSQQRFKASGLVLHMPGLWQFSIVLRADNEQDLVRWEMLVD